MPIYKFPDSFKWGSATSAHQIEGDNHNDWSEWERSPMRLEQLKKEGKDPSNFISGKTCDSYNRYEEDFDIVKQLNQNIHRFSIEWSRIEPEEGRFNEKEMQHYIDVVKALKKRGIEPMITLWHFTNPIWFAKKGGWLNPKSPELFVKFIKVVVSALKDQVGLWITFNEATTVYSGFSYLNSLWPPQHKNILEWRRVNKNFIKAHIMAYNEIKKIYNHSPINLNNKNSSDIILSPPNPASKVMSHNVEVGLVEHTGYFDVNLFLKVLGIEKILNYFYNNYCFRKAFPYYDFIGLNYYTARKILKKRKSETIETDMGWDYFPQGMYNRLSDLKKFKKPIFITENGWPFKDDDFQLRVIRDNLFWINKAISGGADVKGYLYWSLLDNFEWHLGYSKRFGLVEVDFKTFERRIRPSALEYAKICKDNQLIY